MDVSVLHNIRLEVRWISRESGEIRMADDLSKELDFGEYRLSSSSFIYIRDAKHEGLYSMFFHNCYNYFHKYDSILIE